MRWNLPLFLGGLTLGILLSYFYNDKSPTPETKGLDSINKVYEYKIDSLEKVLESSSVRIEDTNKEEQKAENEVKNQRDKRENSQKKLDAINDSVFDVQFLDSLAEHVKYR